MNNFLIPILQIAYKDIILELRTKDIFVTILIFALLMGIIFSFVFVPTKQNVVLILPGTLWVSITFAGVLGFNRSLVLEKDKGSLDGLLLCPVTRDVIYLGKFLGLFLFMISAEIFIVPLYAVLYNVSILDVGIPVIVILTTIGFAAVGTLFSAICVNTRSREVMLPILLLPVSVPIIVAAVEGTRSILEGSTIGIERWVQLLVAFDVIFLILASFTFGAALEE